VFGPAAEKKAARFLARRGCRILTKNFRTKAGEIDLVVADGETIVFVEVRARAPGAIVSALESIGFAKRRRVRLAALAYLGRARVGDRPIRFDVVAVTGEEIDWLKGAF
jgi:putative endonuclease